MRSSATSRSGRPAPHGEFGIATSSSAPRCHQKSRAWAWARRRVGGVVGRGAAVGHHEPRGVGIFRGCALEFARLVRVHRIFEKACSPSPTSRCG